MKRFFSFFTSKNLALFLCGVAAVSLVFPLYSSRDIYDSAFLVTVRGFNLAELSGWGGVTVAMPFLLAILQLCRTLPSAAQTVCWFIFNLTGAYALPSALSVSRAFLTENVGQFVSRHYGLAIFIPLLIVASIVSLIGISNKSLPAIVKKTERIE